MATYSDSNIIVQKIYPIVSKSLEKNTKKLLNTIGVFMTKNSHQIYDVAPYDNIYYTRQDIDDLFRSLEISENEILNLLKECFFWKLAYRPLAIKEPYVVVVMMCIKYFIMHKMPKEAEITCIYLAFSGKFYASIFSAGFTTAPPSKHKEVMDYVINNMLTDKHSLKTEGTMFGAIKSLCNTFLNTYESVFKDTNLSDNEVGKKLIQQLRDREKSFMINIVKLYYEAYDNKLYLNYETDNLAEEGFRLTSSDSLRAAGATENTMSYMTTNGVSLQICNKCKNENVKATEVKDIMESILMNKSNLHDMRRVVNILICDYFRNYPGKDINSVNFISYSIKAKPNTKDKYLIELKDTILKWLDENSDNYRRRKNRTATAINYYKSILSYIVLTITQANK